MHSYYELLGVDQHASTGTIHGAYCKLCLRYHPDGREANVDHFKKIQRAFEVLSNPESRKQYDNSLPITRPSRSTQRSRRQATQWDGYRGLSFQPFFDWDLERSQCNEAQPRQLPHNCWVGIVCLLANGNILESDQISTDPRLFSFLTMQTISKTGRASQQAVGSSVVIPTRYNRARAVLKIHFHNDESLRLAVVPAPSNQRHDESRPPESFHYFYHSSQWFEKCIMTT